MKELKSDISKNSKLRKKVIFPLAGYKHFKGKKQDINVDTLRLRQNIWYKLDA